MRLGCKQLYQRRIVRKRELTSSAGVPVPATLGLDQTVSVYPTSTRHMAPAGSPHIVEHRD
eukprot:325928-Prymnesium_polylepis.1